jgi:hypothetical protein
LPLVIVGMGAQAESDEISNLKLHSETVQCLELFSELSVSIGVRGEFTQHVCEAHGVKNVVVIGCPSNFINSRKDLGAAIGVKMKSSLLEKLVVSGDNFKDWDVHIKAQQLLLKFIDDSYGSYFCQAPLELISMARCRFDEIDTCFLEEVRRFLLPNFQNEAMLSYVKKNFVTVLGVESWLELLSSFDLYVGMRIHGAIAAIQAGIPAILIGHDSRTVELATTHKLPFVRVDDFVKSSCLHELMANHNFCFDLYDANREVLYMRYSTLFSDVGVEIYR